MLQRILVLSTVFVMSGPALAASMNSDDSVISLACDVAPTRSLLDGGYTSEETVVAYPAQKRIFYLGTLEYKDGSPETDPSLQGRTQYVVITPILISWGARWPSGHLNEATDVDRRTGELNASVGAAASDSAPQIVQVGKCHLVSERKF